jgi:ligand-binding sensor domain-containing protein
MFQLRLILIFIYILSCGILTAQTWESFDASTGLPSNTVQAVCVDSDGHKWFGTTAGLGRFTGAEWVTYQKTESTQTLASNNIRDIAFENSSYGSEIWLATDNGVSVVGVQIDGVTMATPYRSDNTGLVNNAVHAVGVDSSHQRWFGTEGGVSMFTGSAWRSWTTESQSSFYFPNDDVRAIGIDNIEGWRYLCTNGGGVSRLQVSLDGITSASPYDYAWSALMSDTVTSVRVEPDGDQWFGTIHGPAFHDTTETKEDWRVWNTGNGLVDDRIQAIAQDGDGNLWYGTAKGVSKWDGASFTNYTPADGLIHEDVRDIAVDQDGSLWFATAGGVSHFISQTRVEEHPSASVQDFALLPNYPNPFNPSTTLGFRLGKDAEVSLDIFNVAGQRIRTLVRERRSSGTHFVFWNGLTDRGQSAPSGVYVVRLQAIGNGWMSSGTQKMVMMK